MRVGVIDKHGAPIPLLSLIRTLTVGLRVSLSQPPTGCVRVADYNRRFEITSTPITTDAQSTPYLVPLANAESPRTFTGTRALTALLLTLRRLRGGY
jgi:hypothetical protein